MNTNGSTKSDDQVPETRAFQSANNNDLVERIEFVELGLSTNNATKNEGRMPKTKVFHNYL
jgi:hypothetical protein